MPKRTAKLVAGVLTACACTYATPATYRWVDENGMTVYSQTPPPSGDAVKLKKQPSPSRQDAAAARKRVDEGRAQAFDKAEERRDAEAEQAKKAQVDRRRAENCEAARGNLEKVQNLGMRRVRTPDGRILRLSAEQIQVQVEKAQMQMEEYCD